MDTKKVDTTEIKTMSQVSILWNSVRSFLVNKQNLSEYKNQKYTRSILRLKCYQSLSVNTHIHRKLRSVTLDNDF